VCARQVAETFLRPSHPPSVLFYIGKIHVAWFHRQEDKSKMAAAVSARRAYS
jgi:hypothetical protein